MTPEAAAEALEEIGKGPSLSVVDGPGDEYELSPLERRFAEEFLGGSFPRNRTRSYMAANPNANYNTASIEGGRLLKLPRVQWYLRELHRELMEGVPERLQPWEKMAAKAQKHLDDHLDGIRRLTTNDVAVIREVLDRSCGKPKESVEHDIGTRLDSLIKELSGRRPNRLRTRNDESLELSAGVEVGNNGDVSGERS